MPYVKESEREVLNETINELFVHLISKGVSDDRCNAWKGSLNYIVTKLCHSIISARGLRYHTLNDLTGVLECIKQELYRMVAAPYENTKQEENGSISELD